MINIKKQIREIMISAMKQLNVQEDVVIEKPKDQSLGDFAIPCFMYSKLLKESPDNIAKKIVSLIDKNSFEKIETKGGYINLFLKKSQVTDALLKEINEQKELYGSSAHGKSQKVVIDYSAPNIAKPFGVGHLRSTVIGNAIKKIYEKCGYEVFGINYIGDWGTQFGKLIYAYKTWGKEELLEKEAVLYLKKLYIKFHEEAELNDELNDEGRKWFKKIENQDPEAIELWQKFRKLSMESFDKVYKILGVDNFDTYQGESFFNDKTADVVKLLEDNSIIEEDDGAKIIRFEDDTPPALIQKSDGTSLYMTRDLAAILYRRKEYKFDKIIYVTGNEQTLHFKQLKKVIEKLNLSWYNEIVHISFGLVLIDGKRMRTRVGRDVLLEEVLTEAKDLAYKYIEEKNPLLEEKVKTSEIVGIGAVIFNDLKNFRTYDINFNLEDILKFEGETGPYIQYTCVRINSLLENKELNGTFENLNISNDQWNVTIKLMEFEETISRAANNYDPSEIAKYAIDLAQIYNKFYANEKMLSNNEEQTLKLNLSYATRIVLRESMRLLGIKIPDKM